jgi:hypothetical protein
VCEPRQRPRVSSRAVGEEEAEEGEHRHQKEGEDQMSSPPLEVTRAQAFVLTDGEGRDRARLGMSADGPSLEFVEPSTGQIRLAQGVAEGEME